MILELQYLPYDNLVLTPSDSSWRHEPSNLPLLNPNQIYTPQGTPNNNDSQKNAANGFNLNGPSVDGLSDSPKSLFTFSEGCLSVPGFNEEITRPDKIILKWQNLDGDNLEDEPEGLLTVCIQHEIDHLEGKLMVDYLSTLKRDRIRNKLNKRI